MFDRFSIIYSVKIPKPYGFAKPLINYLYKFGSSEAKRYCIRLCFAALEEYFFSQEMETKALCFVFVFLILVTLPSESEAGINGWRKRKPVPKPKGGGEGLFQKKRNLWVSTLITSCLDDHYVSVLSLSKPISCTMAPTSTEELFNDFSR